jgi:transposase-like protein
MIPRWVRYALSLRDLAEMLLQRDFVFIQKIVWNWKARLTPLRTELLRQRRHGAVQAGWYVDMPDGSSSISP